MRGSQVIIAVRAFKRAVVSREEEAVRELAMRYLNVQKAIEANITALSEQVNALYAAGEDPSWSQIYRLERWQRLEAQLISELARFNGWAADLIAGRQWHEGLQGAADAAKVLNLARPGLPVAMPHEAVRSVVGVAKNGAPLGDLLAASYAPARTTIAKEIVNAVALGKNPRATAAAIRRATGIPLDSALRLARTEQMRAYNTASIATYHEMGVTQYERLCDFGERTCIACLALNGQILDSESELDDHPLGRCTAVPIVPDVRNEPIPSSEAWFNRQPESVQKSIAGPGRLEAYKSGAVQWSELAQTKHDPAWGGTVQPVPVSELPAA